MSRKKIGAESWRELYAAAEAFKKTACWELMADTDLFAVENPENGKIGYCCVLGNLGEIFALMVYLGDKGFTGYRRIQEGEFEDDSNLYMVQDCLMASFENKSYLQKEDLGKIADLGLAFKGKRAWPCFRSLKPGYMPWTITEPEARFLGLALRQAVDVADRFRMDPALLRRRGDGMCLLRKKNATGEVGTWKDEYVPIPTSGNEKCTGLFDAGKAEKIRKKFKKESCRWEVDVMESPIPVAGPSRPYFPMSLIAVETKSGFVYGNQFDEPWDFKERITQFFLDTIEQAGYVPSGVSTKKSTSAYLSPLLSFLGIELAITDHLPACFHFVGMFRKAMTAKGRGCAFDGEKED